MILLLFFISLIQTIVGILFIGQIGQIFNGGEFNLGLTVFMFIIAAALAIVVSFKIRKYEVILPIIIEILLTPLAIFRFAIGGIFALLMQKDFALEHEADELLNTIAEYMLYFEISDTASISKGGNFVSMLLFALPTTFIMFYSFWNDIYLCDWAFKNFNVSLPRYNIIIGILIILLLSGALCVIRSQSTEYSTYNERYKFKNKYTGKKSTIYSKDELFLTKKGIDRGWEKVSGGTEYHFTTEMIATIFCSPFLFFTYLIGVIASFLSFFIYSIYSCIGSIDYNDVPASGVQRILHFFCAFVIAPDLAKNRKIEKMLKNSSQSRDTFKSPTTGLTTTRINSPYRKQPAKTYKKKRSFGETIALPFVKIWEGIKKLFEFIKDKCHSATDFLKLLATIIFFPFILIYKGIKLLVIYFKDNCDSFLGFFVVLGKLIISPFVFLFRLLFGGGDNEESSIFTFLVTFLAAGVAGIYLLIIRTGFIDNIIFEIDTSWLSDLFSKFYFTNIVKGWFDGAGILVIVLAILIAAVAVIEAILFVLSFILSLLLTLLLGIFQLAYIAIIPIGLVLFSLIMYLKSFSQTGIVCKILSLLFIIGCGVLVFLYAKDLIPLMFPK